MPWGRGLGRMRGWRCFGRGWNFAFWRGRGRGMRAGPPAKCVCPNCGYEVVHVRGRPCSSEICPKCGSRMVGKWE